MYNHSSKLPERSRPSRACSHKSTIWKEDLVSCNPSSQSSRTPSRPSKRSSMSEEWERSEHLHGERHPYTKMIWSLSQCTHMHLASSRTWLMIQILNYI